MKKQNKIVEPVALPELKNEFENSQTRIKEIGNFLTKYPINEIMYCLGNDNRLVLMNWFYKNHIEGILGEEIDDNVMSLINELHSKYCADSYSESFNENLREIYQDEFQNTPEYIAAHREKQINTIL